MDTTADLGFSETLGADVETLGVQAPIDELVGEARAAPARRRLPGELRTIFEDRLSQLRASVERLRSVARAAPSQAGLASAPQAEGPGVEGPAPATEPGPTLEPGRAPAPGGAPAWRLPAGWRPLHVYAGAGALAALVAVAGASVLASKSEPPAQKAVAEAGVEGPSGLIAPAAKLAGVTPSESSERPVVEIKPPATDRKVVEEVTGFFGREGKDGQPAKSEQKLAGPLPAQPANAVVMTAPSEVGAPANAPLVEPPKAPAKSAAQPVAETSGAAAIAQVAPPKAPLTAPTARAGESDVSVRRKGEEPVRVESGAPTAAEHVETKGLSAEQEIKIYGLITELSTLLRRTREEVTAVREEQKGGTKEVDAKLLDFERRLNFGEAQRALEAAQNVQPKAQEAVVAPAVYTTPAKPATAPNKGVVTASVPVSSDATAGAAPPPVARYRVQAASPGLAMLADVDRSGDGVAPLQVGIGAIVPGYGRVTRISQRGIEWIVLTEKGAIH